MSFDKQHVMGAAAEASEPALLASLPEPVPVSASGDGQAQGLFPCPFCGSREIGLAKKFVFCRRCGAEAGFDDGGPDIRAWNTRCGDKADETAWLVEMVEPDENKPPVPRWWHPEHGWMWDANKALRFAREVDAEDYVKHSRGIRGKATEHKWIAP